MSRTQEIIKKQREFFGTNITKDLRFRKEQLLKLRKAIQEYEGKIIEALAADLNKSAFEAYMTGSGDCSGRNQLRPQTL